MFGDAWGMGMWWFVLSESVVFLLEVKAAFLELSESHICAAT